MFQPRDDRDETYGTVLEQRRKVTTMRFQEDVLWALDHKARELGISRSMLAEQIIVKYLTDHPADGQPEIAMKGLL